MTDDVNGLAEDPPIWSELKLSSWVLSDRVQKLHAAIEADWDPLQRTACQTAAGRALWRHVTNDGLAELLAGETYLRSFYEKIRKDRLNRAREISGVILAVRTLWFDSKLEAAVNSFNNEPLQVVLLGAGMDTRAYRLNCLTGSHVFEIDFPQVLQMKASLLQEAMKSIPNQQRIAIKAKALTSVEADIRGNDWLERLQNSGFIPEKNTVWILEGLLYYLSDSDAIQVLKTIAAHCCLTPTVLLADFMNKPSTTLSNANFQFYSDWPDQLLPSLGFSEVNLSQIGDPDAHFGLLHDPLNMFNKLRSIPSYSYTILLFTQHYDKQRHKLPHNSRCHPHTKQHNKERIEKEHLDINNRPNLRILLILAAQNRKSQTVFKLLLSGTEMISTFN